VCEGMLCAADAVELFLCEDRCSEVVGFLQVKSLLSPLRGRMVDCSNCLVKCVGFCSSNLSWF